MDKADNIHVLNEELESLRERLNNYIAKNINPFRAEKYENLLAISIELDDVIVNYIKSSNQ